MEEEGWVGMSIFCRCRRMSVRRGENFGRDATNDRAEAGDRGGRGGRVFCSEWERREEVVA